VEEGLELTRRILLDLDGQFHAAGAARPVHQWIGAGGLLGFHSISRMARELEILLLEKPLDASQVRESTAGLALAFSHLRDTPVPDAIRETLRGKVVGIVGLPAGESHRLCAALEHVEARPVFFELHSAPGPSTPDCDLIVTWVRPDTAGSPWLDPHSPAAALPNVLTGASDHVFGLDPAVQALAQQVLVDSWQPTEALVRLSLAMRRLPAKPASTERGTEPRVVIAAQDEAMIGAVRTALTNVGMDCGHASDTAAALQLIRAQRPDAAVFDVSNLENHGEDLLSAIRDEGIPTRIVLLTSRQRESDVIRGFDLGADDYLVAPFNPLELAARVRRALAAGAEE
jgi:CheY-like chemotaxis protein